VPRNRHGLRNRDKRLSESMLRDYRLLCHEEPEIAREIKRRVDGLPANLHKAVDFVYWCGMGKTAATEKLNCDESTTRRWCLRAIGQLRLKSLHRRYLEWKTNKTTL
jgi:DNA-directed RNA polymerase specialized sigma24 family protein